MKIFHLDNLRVLLALTSRLNLSCIQVYRSIYKWDDKSVSSSAGRVLQILTRAEGVSMVGGNEGRKEASTTDV